MKNQFYNTTRAKGDKLKQYDANAQGLSELIYAIFKRFPRSTFTPFDILYRLQFKGYKYPITSVRRAITNLTLLDGLLIKHDIDKKSRLGEYHMVNHLWQKKPVSVTPYKKRISKIKNHPQYSKFK